MLSLTFATKRKNSQRAALSNARFNLSFAPSPGPHSYPHTALTTSSRYTSHTCSSIIALLAWYFLNLPCDAYRPIATSNVGDVYQ